MKLEKAIAQQSFKNEYQKAAINLFFTANWAMFHTEKHFKNKELTSQQFNTLRILRGQYPKPCNLKLIKERMLDRMSDVSRIVDKLAKKGYLERTECPNDRRNVDILISEKGLATLAELDFIDEEVKKNFGSLNEKEIKLL
ncbi:MAG: MarR family transcriptional regulator, partial [Bacteroidia bacterium]|nr:MarR family transcriptional regulator [Bacteroidia bacterium]